jgi:hypothetical protein
LRQNPKSDRGGDGRKQEIRTRTGLFKDVPAPQEVWDLARKNFLANKWWRGPDHPETPEGDKKYQDFYESPWTMKGDITFK